MFQSGLSTEITEKYNTHKNLLRMEKLELLTQANDMFDIAMPWILAISAGIVLYQLIRARIYHLQAKRINQ